MTIIQLTDLHGAVAGIDRIEAEIRSADLLVVSGDITHFGGRLEAAAIIEPLAALARRLLAVAGNCDTREVEDYLTELGINLDRRSLPIGDLRIAGLGASLPGPMATPNTVDEEELSRRLSESGSEIDGPFLLVSHQPPYGTQVDRAMKMKHVGSRSVREFIAQRKPLVCMSGHIHESQAVDELDGCRLINPGPFGSGRFGRIVVGTDGTIETSIEWV